MKEHSWKVETIDCGIDICDFLACEVCGASAGFAYDGHSGVNWDHPQLGKLAPFLAGPGLKVSFDCDEALVQIQGYILDRIKHLRRKRSLSRHYASFLSDVLRWTPEKTDWRPVLDVCDEFLRAQGKGVGAELTRARIALLPFGFRTSPKSVSDAVSE